MNFNWFLSWQAWAVSAALIGVTLIPLGTFWGFNLCGKHGRHQAQPLRLTRIFLHMAFPAYLLAVATAIIFPVTAIVRVRDQMDDQRMIDLNWQAAVTSFYGSAVSSLLATAASVLASHAVYLAGLSVWYLVLAKKKWWKAAQLDTIFATVVLIAFDIAWFAKTIADFLKPDADRIRLDWLLVIINLALCLVAALNVGLAIYCAAKLNRRGDLVVGNLPSLFLAASLLWLLRCAFVLAVEVKYAIPNWIKTELSTQKIIYPILDYWVSATVLGLVTFMVRNRVWSDPSVFADRGHWQQRIYVQPMSQYSQPQYGQQQHQQVCENPHQDYQQQQQQQQQQQGAAYQPYHH